MRERRSDRFSGCSVLLVEGDTEIARDLREDFGAIGCEVCWESSASGFQQRKDIPSFAAIFIDRSFIDDLLPKIQATSPLVPVVVMSGQWDTREAVRAIRHGAADYIVTPIQPNELKITLAHVLTQRAKTEAYQQEKAFSEDLLDLVPAIILNLDAEGRIVRFNRFLEQLSGYRLEEVKGRDWFETFLTEHDRPHVREAVQETLCGGTVSGSIHPIITRTGEHRQISWRCTAIYDARDEATGFLATGQDVTDLLAAQKKASQSERLATIGQTMATLSHETRNELHALNMGLELLSQLLGNQEEALEIVESLKHEQARLSRLFEDVRGFAAPMKLERTNHGLSEIWRKAWNSIENIRQERDATLHEQIDALPVQCFVDSFRLEQVFRNLFENSLAACADPVEITIACSHIQQNGHEVLQISIRDNGPGIPPDHQDKIFDAFVTTKQDGTGLGLALTKRVIEVHHGSIDMKQPSDRGAEFVITLPVASEMEESLEVELAAS